MQANLRVKRSLISRIRHNSTLTKAGLIPITSAEGVTEHQRTNLGSHAILREVFFIEGFDPNFRTLNTAHEHKRAKLRDCTFQGTPLPNQRSADVKISLDG